VNGVVGAVIALATDSTSKPSPALRIFVAAGALALIYLILTSEPVTSRFPLLTHIPGANIKEGEQQMADDKSIKITSHNQSGGITAHTVHVAETPPSLNVAILEENEQYGDAYRTSVALNLNGRPARFGVSVVGKHIRDLMLRQDGPSTFLSNVEKGDVGDGRHVFFCQHPNPGRYIAEIESTAPENDLRVEPLIQ
jgi:hypothetical protein